MFDTEERTRVLVQTMLSSLGQLLTEPHSCEPKPAPNHVVSRHSPRS